MTNDVEIIIALAVLIVLISALLIIVGAVIIGVEETIQYGPTVRRLTSVAVLVTIGALAALATTALAVELLAGNESYQAQKKECHD